MKKILFLILYFVGANCSCLSMNFLKGILTQLKNSTNGIQNSLNQLSTSVVQNMKDGNDCQNESSSISKSNLDELQINLTKKIDQKFASISEDHKNSALNMSKLQTSVDHYSESVAQNMKYIIDSHNQSSSNSKMFERKLNEMQKKLEETEQIIDQKFASISEDLQKSVLNTSKLQTSVDQLSEEHNETSYLVKTLEQKFNELQETVKILDQKIWSISKDNQKFGHQLDSIKKIQNQQETLQKEAQNLADDCSYLYNLGLNVSTSYFLQKYKKTVLCDMETDGGGWLVIQQRKKVTEQVDFYRNWASYKEGFGELDTEFWIGNEFLHRITNQKSYELRIDMEDFQNRTFYAIYSKFLVANEESGYKLRIGRFEGNITDRLSYNDEQKFTTLDRDNDAWSGNCAKEYSAGFWYKTCGNYAHLNSFYPTDPGRKNDKLIRWKHNGEDLVLMKVEMKIRPKQEPKISV